MLRVFLSSLDPENKRKFDPQRDKLPAVVPDLEQRIVGIFDPRHGLALHQARSTQSKLARKVFLFRANIFAVSGGAPA
eukprot:SAG31_NODE_19929_length_588_cov_0.848671_1_plen_78_part_00